MLSKYIQIIMVLVLANVAISQDKLAGHVSKLFRNYKIKFTDARINKSNCEHDPKSFFWDEYVSLSRDYNIDLSVFLSKDRTNYDLDVTAESGYKINEVDVFGDFCFLKYKSGVCRLLMLPEKDCLQLEVFYSDKKNRYADLFKTFTFEDGFDKLLIKCVSKKQSIDLPQIGVRRLSVKSFSDLTLNLLDVASVSYSPVYIDDIIKHIATPESRNQKVIRARYILKTNKSQLFWNNAGCKIVLNDGKEILPVGSGTEMLEKNCVFYFDFPDTSIKNIDKYIFSVPSEVKIYTIYPSDFRELDID